MTARTWPALVLAVASLIAAYLILTDADRAFRFAAVGAQTAAMLIVLPRVFSPART